MVVILLEFGSEQTSPIQHRDFVSQHYGGEDVWLEVSQIQKVIVTITARELALELNGAAYLKSTDVSK